MAAHGRSHHAAVSRVRMVGDGNGAVEAIAQERCSFRMVRSYFVAGVNKNAMKINDLTASIGLLSALKNVAFPKMVD